MNNNTCREIGIVNGDELPVLEYASQLDYFIGIANIVVPQTQEMQESIVIVPSEAVVPQGNSANEFRLEANNPSLSVPTGQVVPAYVQPGSIPNMVAPATSANNCDFLVLSVENGLATCQNTGIINFPNGHKYQVIGAQYYLSNAIGQVTTDASQTGKKLFKVISRTQLMINM